MEDARKNVIELSRDEALVLFDWLSERTAEKAGLVDAAELRVLWVIENHLESQLVEPFLPNYVELLKAAKSRLVPRDDEE